ncbi:hypothetical protein NC653_037168 [Populus alba x Populus x berolinensis]|uniref:Uncharacterized protein n=1 Tax=Populus alba x Populus x berolinensis TaxID=444605 RepID=A0AAD6PRX2_9ROSI|nr:hypothetical protein NC653_037168 [Populus alba x Populus x berolinensis]
MKTIPITPNREDGLGNPKQIQPHVGSTPFPTPKRPCENLHTSCTTCHLDNLSWAAISIASIKQRGRVESEPKAFEISTKSPQILATQKTQTKGKKKNLMSPRIIARQIETQKQSHPYPRQLSSLVAFDGEREEE